MTVSQQTTFNVSLGNGVTTVFPYQFKILAATDLVVYVAGLLKTLNVDYSVAGVGVDVGGSITFLTGAPGVGVRVVRTRSMRRERLTDYQLQGDFDTPVVNPDFDRAILITQELDAQLGRTLRLPPDELDTLPTLPSKTDRAGKYMAFDAGSLPVPSVGTGNDAALRTDLATSVAGVEGSLLIGFRASGAGAIARAVRNKLRDRIDARDFGVIADGVTDDTLAMQLATASGAKHIFVPSGTLKITGSVPILAGQHLRFDRTVVALTGGVVEAFIVSDGINDWSIDGSLLFQGDNDAAGSVAGAAVGLKIINSMRYRVAGVTAQNIKGWGILVQPGTNTANRGEKGNIIAPQAYACYVGIEAQAGTGAEFLNILAPNITRCNTGLRAGAGNTNVTGGGIVDNQTGVIIDAGANSAHGIFSGVNINHNAVFGVQTNQVLNGQSFIGCHFYQNNLFFDRSKGIVLDGGVIDCGVFNYKDGSSGTNVIRNMYCPGGYGFARNAGANNGHDQLLILGCFGPGILSTVDALDAAGLSMNDASPLHLLYKRLANTTQALVSNVASDLLFPSKVFDRRSAHTVGTGVSTISAEKGGLYRIRAGCLFSGTAMNAAASFVEVKVNGASSRLILGTAFGTTKVRIQLDEEIYLNAADTIKLTGTIVGTTPVFGDTTWESYFSLEKIA